MDQDKREHPSYGTATLCRTHGQFTDLFQSGLQTNQAVTLRICNASVINSGGIDHGGDHVHSGRTIAEVQFSPLQFAEFITSIGVGEGIPCTVRYAHGENTEAPPKEDAKAKRAALSFKDKCSDLSTFAHEAEFLIDEILAKGGKMKAADRDQLKTIFKKLTGVATDTGPFLMKQAEEHLRRMTQEAKAEISSHAHATAAITGTQVSTTTLLGEPEGEEAEPVAYDVPATLGNTPAHPVIPDLPLAELEQKSIEEMNARDVAILINRHLKRLEIEQNKINTILNKAGEKQGPTSFYCAQAMETQGKVAISYITYHSSTKLPLAQAKIYLQALRQGFARQHFILQQNDWKIPA